MRSRTIVGSALTLTLLLSVLAPIAHAATSDSLTPLDRSARQAPIAVPTALPTEMPTDDAVRTGADIVKGRPVARGAHPYVSLVLMFNPKSGEVTSLCSGSVIRPRWVLTAGHCLKGAKGVAVVPGLTRTKDLKPSKIIFAEAIGTAPGFKLNPVRKDVGLIKLEKAAPVKPVTVAGRTDDRRFGEGTSARIVGWGATDSYYTSSDRLRRGQIRLASPDVCRALFGGHFVAAGMICGGSRVNDVCVGDSGGPLLVHGGNRWVLLGVTSYGDVDCATGDASGYMRTSSVRTWVQRVTGLPRRR